MYYFNMLNEHKPFRTQCYYLVGQVSHLFLGGKRGYNVLL